MQERLRVGFVTDGGRIDDGSFNQYAYEGTLRAAQEHGLAVELIETQSPAEYEANIRQAIERGCNLVVTIGSTTGTTVERLAARYPKVHFVLVDYEPLEESRNVTGLVFAEDQAGFLAGALAGLMTERDVVGFIGGVDVPPVRKFQVGFEHGVAYTNRRAKVLIVYTNSFTDEQKGEEGALHLVQQGADVLFAAAGGCGSAAIRAAAASGVWVIGSDQDHWETTFRKGETPGADHLLTSAVKRADQAVYEALSMAVAGKLHGGVLRFDLHNDGIGLAPYHAADVAVPSEVRGKVREIADGLRTGRIRTQVGPRGEDLERRLWARIRAWNWRSVAMIFLAIFTALVVGAIFIAAFDPEVWTAFGQGIGAGLVAAGRRSSKPAARSLRARSGTLPASSRAFKSGWRPEIARVSCGPSTLSRRACGWRRRTSSPGWLWRWGSAAASSTSAQRDSTSSAGWPRSTWATQ